MTDTLTDEQIEDDGLTAAVTANSLYTSGEAFAWMKELLARRSRDAHVEGMEKALERIGNVAGKLAKHRGEEPSKEWFAALIEGTASDALAAYRRMGEKG